ncbi:Lipoprotein-anchoring transpeptidase ErfK/SrfK [Haloechinothrix alba]|uniref:Lipoprotein-anchoring transpeptidase ErfK/SrfK n=1 Tax=Haloechinothrix alba TaxID=664784 RepID=A0A238VF46_9PSEU|nr:L,D-transpeptidase [Haloechinothrix alba]SNR33010.1 Lipoprotein-anchoring transpeptidase ErfK/SrfK [Haloechinothrix alba]
MNVTTRDPETRMRPALVLVAVGTLLLVVAGVVAAVLVAGRAATPAEDGSGGSARPGDASSAGQDGPGALVARATGETAIYDDPLEQTPSGTVPEVTPFGTETVMLVTENGAAEHDGWLEVRTPVRPNDATGWVREDAVEVDEVDLAVDIDLDGRELTVLDSGEELLSTQAGIGEPAYPTPPGRFYVTDKLQTPEPGGAYGPYALGLSAYSEVLTEFMGGDGQVGIHGTDTPSSIGQASSHGCVRISNELIEELAHMLPLGTPVTIS